MKRWLWRIAWGTSLLISIAAAMFWWRSKTVSDRAVYLKYDASPLATHPTPGNDWLIAAFSDDGGITIGLLRWQWRINPLWQLFLLNRAASAAFLLQRDTKPSFCSR